LGVKGVGLGNGVQEGVFVIGSISSAGHKRQFRNTMKRRIKYSRRGCLLRNVQSVREKKCAYYKAAESTQTKKRKKKKKKKNELELSWQEQIDR